MVDGSADFQRVMTTGNFVQKLRDVQVLEIKESEETLAMLRRERVSSLDSIAKSRRVIRARTALQAGIARWKGVKALKFMTLTIDNELAQFSKIYCRGGINACWEAFIKRLRRVFGDIQYIKVCVPLAVSSHLHIILNVGWVGQRFLSDLWEDISNCPVMDIRTLWYGRGLRNYLGHYVSNQGRLGYSQGWIFRGWRFHSQKVFSRLKQRYLPKWDACPFCANIFYRYVWYKRILPWLLRQYNDELIKLFAGLKYPVFEGNWTPKVFYDLKLPLWMWV